MKLHNKIGVASAALGLTALMLGRPDAQAADHIDGPMAAGDGAADITDFFAWQEGDNIVAAIGFAGLAAPGDMGTYDDEMLYGIHVDNDGDNEPDQTVWVRFGQDPDGNWGVLFEGIPGGEAQVIGPVNTEIDAGLGLRAFAGSREDPFFFDFDGFGATLMTGTLMFDSMNDTFAGTNVTMIIVELSIDGAAGGSDNVALWSTSARKAAE